MRRKIVVVVVRRRTSFLPKDTRDIWRESANTSRLFDAYINVESQKPRAATASRQSEVVPSSSSQLLFVEELLKALVMSWHCLALKNYPPLPSLDHNSFPSWASGNPRFSCLKKANSDRRRPGGGVGMLMLQEKNWRCKNPFFSSSSSHILVFLLHLLNTLSQLWKKHSRSEPWKQCNLTLISHNSFFSDFFIYKSAHSADVWI